jgi:hypothetical protein
MPSTYSNLKIQLMATGENNTTWGNVTNDNLGVAIEEAIAGSADVTFSSGDVTLTLTNTNATQTARNMRLRCTGTTGGARSLIVPAIEKAYIVQNDCADAITVKNATGTGIAVPAGRAMWVYNDATNVVAATTHLTSLTVASPITNQALTNPTVTNYVETLFAPAAGSSFTVALSDGTVQRFTTNANTTITLPASVAGKSFVIIVQYGGAHTLTWAGGSTLKWSSGVTPSPTSATGKIDIFTFFQDGTNTYGAIFGQNF